ncbi:MATE family efflux transporter [Halalkalibacter akibai]|uniref:Probable multidrug resistance protein NorM n=1 Tax=Halalkalibacter akibai (strain ATCC 43226 / DSM 21942 / CIP 109018 / JCM 9157 / 1139) TaxID=1236973 RepID=W4QV38_HALA3|nr:MATE family efflux transporter [Halalkalibacter akibai]GAE35473.1 multi antimicrobial extrusion protein [Halalkalibacter akibai JCM 9157]
MYHAETWKEKITLLLAILWPIMVTQVSLFAMNLIDTMMSGRVGTEDLAGVAIGSSLWMPVFSGINGILLAVTPIVAHLIGSGKKETITASVIQGLYLSVLLAVLVVIGGFFFLEPLLVVMNLEQDVHYIAFHYLIGLSFGIIPLFAANVLRYFFDAQGYTRITMIITILAVPFNILLNYGLIFGKLGLPALGGIGAGYATAITYWIIFLFSVWMTFKVEVIRQYRLFKTWAVPSWKAMKEQLSIGIPIGLSIFFEASIFAVVTLLIGMMFSTITVAAHQVALNFTTLIFMIPLSISMALTIVVGFSVGGRKFEEAKQYSKLGVLGGIGILSIGSIFLYFLREPIAYLYTNDPEVVLLAGQFFILAIIYQISDAAQAGLQGVLRGYKDVKIPFITAFISYWLIGIPVGYLLAAYTVFGPFGYWIGIIIGLTCAAIGFYVRLQIVQKKVELGEKAVV